MHSSFKKLALKSCLSLALVFAIVGIVAGLNASAKYKTITGPYQALTLATYGSSDKYELKVQGANRNPNSSATMTTKLRRGNTYGSSTVLRTNSRSCGYLQMSDIEINSKSCQYYWGSSTQVFSQYSDTRYGSLPVQ